MVIDTSVVIAVLFDEAHSHWAAARLNENATDLLMSTVNLAETLVLVQDRQPRMAKELKERLLTSGIQFLPPDVEQAEIAASARVKFPLNFGDCFAYALARVENHPILTLDADFKKADHAVVMPE